VYDSSSHAHHGTLINEARVVGSGKRGKSVEFDGNNDYISFSDASAHKPEKLTISFWIKSDGTIQDDWIVSKQVSGSSDYNYGYLVRLDSPSNNVICLFGYGSSRVSISHPLNPDTWHHVACTYDGISAQLFVDGELKRNKFISESIDYSNVEALSIGAGNTGSLGFKGFIDELVLFSRALSGSEIKALYNSRSYRLERDFYDSRSGNYQLQAFVIDESGVISQTERRTITVSHPSWCNYDHHCNFSSGENYQTCSYDCPFDISSRPRLLLTPERINLLKSRINSQEPYTDFWAKFKSWADSYAKETPPSQSEFAEMWEGSLRQYGNKMPYIALAYLLTEDKKYLDGATMWMDALSNYPDWGSNTDLAASHILLGMSITYDWLYDEFTEEERVRYRNKMIYHTDILYDNLVRDTVWWARNYQQNHNHVNSLGIMAAAVALYGDGAKSKKYIDVVYDNFGAVLDILPPDGSWSEGVSYYGYALYALNNYFNIEKYLYGYDRRLDSDWFRNTTYYRLYASVPGYVKVITFADSPDHDWYAINGLLSDIGSLFNNLYAQWLGEKVREMRDQYNYRSWVMYKWPALIYYNESLGERTPYDLPTYRYFYDLGLFTSRSSWEDDEAIFVAFKAGPPIGHHAEDIGFAKGSGHVRPDEGEFLLYAFGKEMIIDKIFMNLKYIWTTSAHNTITFDTSEIGQGIGQLGETYYDPPGFRHNNVFAENGTVDIIHTDFTHYYEYLVANLTRIYPKALGIKNLVRHLLFVNKSMLVITDEIESESPHDIHWHIHTPRTGSVSSYDRKFVFSWDNVGFRLDDISEMNLQRVNEVYNLTYPEGHPYYGSSDFYETNRIRLTAPQTTDVKIETVIRPYKNNVSDDLEISRSNGYVNIVSGNTTINFSADERKVHVSDGLAVPADLDKDGNVDIQDLTIVSLHFGQTESHQDWNATADVVPNGEIDVFDVVFVASRFN
jgi:hypothetical protein